MRLLVTGICGFVGSTLAKSFLEMIEGIEIFGIDSLIRPGSELNRRSLSKLGCKIIHGDVRSRSDLDQLPPRDLAALVTGQLADADTKEMDRIWNIGGGPMNSMSLAELSGWCGRRINKRQVEQHLDLRPFDVPWIVMNAALARTRWGWEPAVRLAEILEEIADHAEKNPEWLQVCEGSPENYD